MSSTIALTGTTGKLGGAVLEALLHYKLTDPASLVVSTSSNIEDARWESLKTAGVQVRYANFDTPRTMESAFQGCDKAFIVSSSTLSLDFNNAAQGGREKHHIAAIEAARKAGVKHIYYTSLGFADHSKSGVMRAHLETERYLRDHVHDVHWTVLREGLYNESWPLYFGHWDVQRDDRLTVKVCGDGRINWTSLSDLGLANAVLLVESSDKWRSQVVTLSAPGSLTLREMATLVSSAQGKAVSIQIVSKDEHEQYYIKERGLGEGLVRWWSTTYDALRDGECSKQDPTLHTILGLYDREPIPLSETITAMVNSAKKGS